MRSMYLFFIFAGWGSEVDKRLGYLASIRAIRTARILLSLRIECKDAIIFVTSDGRRSLISSYFGRFRAVVGRVPARGCEGVKNDAPPGK